MELGICAHMSAQDAKAEAGGPQVSGQPGLHSEFKQDEHKLDIEILSQSKIQRVKHLKVSTRPDVRLSINTQCTEKAK